jgi:predicted nucleic acid-binding protein
MTKVYVLDANAILDFVESGPGANTVERLFRDAVPEKIIILISVINWGEVLYLLWKKRGEQKARDTMVRLLTLPIQLVSVELSQADKAAAIKALHKVPFVDCLAAALAELRAATLVTGDHDLRNLGVASACSGRTEMSR